MAITAYCKKCAKDVPVGETCSFCGAKLAALSVHTAWRTERLPVKDWMCWNQIMRLVVPGGMGILALILIAEWISGGAGATVRLLEAGLIRTILILLCVIVLVIFILLLLRGWETLDTVVDGRGIHVTTSVPQATKIRMLARFRSPAEAESAEAPVVRVEEIAWKDVTRVQLWPEKCMVLFYAPKAWLRVSIMCTPYTWEDTMTMIRTKIGKKKKVSLPENLRVKTEKKPTRRTGKPAAQTAVQMTMEDMMADPTAGSQSAYVYQQMDDYSQMDGYQQMDGTYKKRCVHGRKRYAQRYVTPNLHRPEGRRRNSHVRH